MPVFRLTFWRQQLPPPGIPAEHMGYEAREFEVYGAEVDAVLYWARSEVRAGKTWTLYVTVRCPYLGLGQVLLAGSDPTAAECS